MVLVHINDLDWNEYEHEHTTFRRKQLGQHAEGDDLGCSMYELPPGKSSWPYHYHAANEEAMYVLEGTGSLRLDGETHTIHEGHYIAFPDDATGAHKVINDSEEPLRYLLFSTMNEPDVAIYPDSEKFGVFVGAPPGSPDEQSLEGYYEIDSDVDYWKGE